MRRFSGAVLWVFLLPTLVMAENTPQARISKKDCRLIIEHRPNADVAYKPGVGRDGKAVTPADLDSNRQVRVPDVVTMDILIPFRVFRPGRRVRGGAYLEGNVGSITVDLKTGRASYNGQPLNNAEQEELYRFCRQQKN